MSLPLRHLPVIQNWECRGCGNCCREYVITVTPEERRRIEAHSWDAQPEVQGRKLFVRFGLPWNRSTRLNQREDGACVFLSPENRCLIHEQLGGTAKPFPCRLYPFILVPAGDHWRAGIRFACPSASENHGQPLKDLTGELHPFMDEIERRAKTRAGHIAPPRLQGRQTSPWSDLHRFVNALTAMLCDRDFRFERRMRNCIALAHLCRQARFDRISGGRLGEFLNLVSENVRQGVPAYPIERPSLTARVLFRQALAVYPRKDQGPLRSNVRNRMGLLAAACRFALGKGRIPRLHGWIPETTFAAVEHATTALSGDAEFVLERYYTTKVGSLQFCGSAHFGFAFWEGFYGLALTLPVILWLVRAQQPTPSEVAAQRAIAMVDRNFGFNPVLRMRRHRMALGILSRGNDLERLIAWYSR